MYKIVGQVTSAERDEIQKLYERRNGLGELAKILTPDNEVLYERLVNDMGETCRKFDQWWSEMSQKYAWESIETGNWQIDFKTCDIILVCPE